MKTEDSRQVMKAARPAKMAITELVPAGVTIAAVIQRNQATAEALPLVIIADLEGVIIMAILHKPVLMVIDLPEEVSNIIFMEATLQQRAMATVVLPDKVMEDLAGIIMTILQTLVAMAIDLPGAVSDITITEATRQQWQKVTPAVLQPDNTEDLAGVIMAILRQLVAMVIDLPGEVSDITITKATPQQREKVTAAVLQRENTDSANITTMVTLLKRAVMEIDLPGQVSNIIITGEILRKRTPENITVSPQLTEAAITSLARMIPPVMTQQRQRLLVVKNAEEMVMITTDCRQTEAFWPTTPIGVLPF